MRARWDEVAGSAEDEGHPTMGFEIGVVEAAAVAVVMASRVQ
jgi:hypothetical protein